MSDKYPVIRSCRIRIVDPVRFCIKIFGNVPGDYRAVFQSTDIVFYLFGKTDMFFYPGPRYRDYDDIRTVSIVNGLFFMIDPADARNIDIEDYASKSEVESFVKSVMEKAGLKSSTAGDLAKEIAGEIFNDFDYDLDFDDDDWDDFDWDDDDDDDDDDQKTTTSSIFDDDDDYEFDPSQFKYEDYKDYMTEEEFNDWMKLMEELMKEAQ